MSARASGWTFHVSQASADYVRPFWEAIKVTVIGRHLFDTTNGWDGDPAAGDELVVVTRRPLPEAWLADHPDAPFHTAGSVEAGIALAKKLAGDGLVCVTAGDLGGQAFSAGLVDEIAMDVAPVVLGEGVRFFGSHAGTVLLDDPDQVVRGDRVLHLHTQSSADRPSTAAALGPSPLPIVSFPKAGLLWDGPDAAYDARGSTGPSAATRCSCTWCWPGSIEPSNVVFAALAECSLVEDRTGWSIRKIVRTVTGLVANGYLPRAKTPPR